VLVGHPDVHLNKNIQHLKCKAKQNWPNGMNGMSQKNSGGEVNAVLLFERLTLNPLSSNFLKNDYIIVNYPTYVVQLWTIFRELKYPLS
jgi:hypothetical protein